MGDVDGDLLLTVAEAADYLTVSVPTVWRWLREGKLSGVKIGNSRRLRLSEVRRFAMAGATGARETAPAYGGEALVDVTGDAILAELRARVACKCNGYPGTEALRQIRREGISSPGYLHEPGDR
ncbi:MAG: Helix-turn-helix domain protein [Firmicutes bacterium ADurb.Bin506]|nr:MAG: Helix-turn-helix domain protein [Firmicutes bacterium ADurb.Bin506]